MGTATSHEPLDRGPAQQPQGEPGAATNTSSNSVGDGRNKEHRKSKRGGERPLRKMDRLRRSFRDSFRKKREHVPEASKPHQWQSDESSVRAGTCSFHVKYMGCVEVYESRGMPVCEDALKALRNSRRRPVKAILYVSGDGLRVVEDETKGLIVDQTIEKVSFCAPDRNHEKGFSYICRDGTTRRWMCHGFLALKESGERLSHAVGCAFAACLERKQRRDKECGVTLNFDPTQGSFARLGSFRQASLPERSHPDYSIPAQDPQECKPAPPPPPPPPPATGNRSAQNPYAIERPHATPLMLQRQGSFRAFSALGAASPFKRQLSLRLGELPSNLQRQRAMSLGSAAPNGNPHAPLAHPPSSGGGTNLRTLSPPAERPADAVSALCMQVTRGLNLLSSASDETSQGQLSGSQPDLMSTSSLDASSPPLGPTSEPITRTTTVANNNNNISTTPWDGSWTNPAAIWHMGPISSTPRAPQVASTTTATPVPPTAGLPRPEQWLGSVSSSAAAMSGGHPPPVRRAPHISHLRSQSLGAAEAFLGGGGGPGDPFDVEWAALAARQNATNPFVTPAVSQHQQVTTSFEVPL